MNNNLMQLFEDFLQQEADKRIKKAIEDKTVYVNRIKTVDLNKLIALGFKVRIV